MSQPPQYPQYPPPGGSPPAGPPPGGPPGWGQAPGWGRPPEPPRRNNTALIVVVVLLVVVAIGGGVFLLTQDDDEEPASTGNGLDANELSEEGQAYVDAIGGANDASSQELITTDEARCIAAATVEIVGVDTLQAAVTPDEIRDDPAATLIDFGIEIDQAQNDELAAATQECVDIVQVVVDGLETQGASQEVLDCVEANVNADVAAALITAEYAGSQEVRDAALADFENAAGSCQQLDG
jgi:hypothetical protein